ncbi:TetR family transcriptional regulator [Halomonas sp. MCCC 1A17488]|jgi:TetR/AcrR family transcriptional regulator|uniref:TetR family transcriptional regulator n=2 Tax=Billgrantia TaxID=3137761 RepID=A0A6I6SFU7_9GAMM|nr:MULTISPECIES: TetR family transcriptional regulator [Halomonas]MCE8017049.1 TetR family transcriptional regulator [Halomonas sp. MCCC 1A17488]MCE8035024.1 TetR family transcriptional regulator [Halomonas sp. MCCC 1A11057]MCG3240382.1 TetR family transcriptional regulator [Halomonas sp. MCCC 1A17488]QHC48472.1 TetR family transcriptional regulator [Halomonas tianxiuensis]QPP49754.1 TetR/AcrR family transcriptional regulator C-terminal domain-containing protein [Halomonas sp. SS10-MC5]
MSGKRNLTAAERRERTVDTVIELSARDDPANITTGSIAKHMRVTQGALFRHFPSKDAVWEAVIGRIAERIIKRLDRAAASADSPLAALEAMFHAHIAFIVEHPGVPRLMMGQLQHARPTPARRMVRSLLFLYRERIEKLLIEAQEAGDLRRELNIEAAATQFIGTIQGLVMQSLMIGSMNHIAEQAQGAFDLYCHGIQQERGTHP